VNYNVETMERSEPGCKPLSIAQRLNVLAQDMINLGLRVRELEGKGTRIGGGSAGGSGHFTKQSDGCQGTVTLGGVAGTAGGKESWLPPPAVSYAWSPVDPARPPPPDTCFLGGRWIGTQWVWSIHVSVTPYYWENTICNPALSDKITHWAFIPDWLTNGPRDSKI
jgi:hypothetical protein